MESMGKKPPGAAARSVRNSRPRSFSSACRATGRWGRSRKTSNPAVYLEPPIGIGTDDLRITRGLLPCVHAMTCTYSTADRTGNADCTRISPRPFHGSAIDRGLSP